MKEIQLLDKRFRISIPSDEIQHAIQRLAKQINDDLRDKNPLMVCILNGSFMFSADLLKLIDFPCQISFVKFASYDGVSTTGTVKQLIGFNEELKNRTIVILEDIVDTGITIENSVAQLKVLGAKEVIIATLLYKDEAYTKNIKLDYIGLSIPNEFIVGYGLDYKGYGRNFPDIYKVIE